MTSEGNQNREVSAPASRPTPTAAPKPRRLIAVDLLRGYFIFAIIVDHLHRFPGFFDIFTGRGWLWVSAAEGFFFLSGMMVGMVRGKRVGDEPFRNIAAVIWRRAGKLYIWSVILTLFFTLWAAAVGGAAAPGVKEGLCDTRDAAAVIWNALTLQYSYGWTDFLRYYVILMFAAPFALWLVARRRFWWIVPLLSVIAWRQLPGMDLVFSWQLPFFLGLTVGFYLHRIESAAARVPKALAKPIAATVVVSAAITMAASHFFSYSQNYGYNIFRGVPILADPAAQAFAFYNAHLIGRFSRWPIGVGRIAMFLLWFAAAYYLVRRYEDRLARWFGWFLIPLGRYSLHAFILHGLLVFAVDIYLPKTGGLLYNVLVVSISLGAIWYITKRKLLFWLIPT